jgi:hypothetical protein
MRKRRSLRLRDNVSDRRMRGSAPRTGMAYTNRQTKIMEWLAKVNPHSGRLFDAAVRLTANAALPCRGRFVAHAYREICSGLLNQYSSNTREEMAPRLDRLTREYGKLNNAPEPTPAASGDALAEGAPALPAVPVSFMQAVGAVVMLHSAAPKGKERAQAIFAGMTSNRRAGALGVSQTADRWFRMYNYFVACVHDRETDDGEMMGADFEREASFFEDTLLSFAEPAIANLDALDDILEEANA